MLPIPVTRMLGLACLLLAAFTPCANAVDEVTVAADGTMHLPAVDVPLSPMMSPAARQRFVDEAVHPYEFDMSGDIARERESVDGWYRPRVERARALFPVKIRPLLIGGVRTDEITPEAGIGPRNHSRVLINLHGGGMLWGGHLGGLAESIPISALGRIRVIAVDYRLAPEFRHPAAQEDLAAVYRELLKRYRPGQIGIYGCSAGAGLTAGSIAWFKQHGLPRPGAIGLFCWGGGDSGGDSFGLQGLLDVSWEIGIFEKMKTHPLIDPAESYFSTADSTDPVVAPAGSPATLAQFPPTLLLSGTRDAGMSNVVFTHAQLVKAGVEADLHVWEGMGHNFLLEMDLPECREAYDVIVRFFTHHLR